MYNPKPLPKIAITMTLASLAVLGYFTFYEVPPGRNDPIQVTYKDGMPPVDKVYTYKDATYTDIKIACPNKVVSVRVVTYEDKEFTEANKKELIEIICVTLEKM